MANASTTTYMVADPTSALMNQYSATHSASSLVKTATAAGSSVASTLGNTVQQSYVSAQSNLSLSQKVTAFTNSLFGNGSIPDFLQHYVPLFQTVQNALLFASGAAAGTGFYHILQQHRTNRQKIKLAVFHVIRLIENNKNYAALLQCPQELVREMDLEVTRMINEHLTEKEGEIVFRQLKRKVWLRELPSPKRKRCNSVEDVETQCNPLTKETTQGQCEFELEPSDTKDFSPMDLDSPPASSLPQQPQQQEQLSPVIPYTPSKSGYGFTYSPESPSSSCSAESSPKNQAPEPFPPPPQHLERLNLIDREIAKAFDPNSPGNRPYVRRRLVVKPTRTRHSRAPPSVMGTSLSPITEDESSMTPSPPETTQYRVNESRQFYAQLATARKKRQKSPRCIKNSFSPGSSQQQKVSPKPAPAKFKNTAQSSSFTYEDGQSLICETEKTTDTSIQEPGKASLSAEALGTRSVCEQAVEPTQEQGEKQEDPIAEYSPTEVRHSESLNSSPIARSQPSIRPRSSPLPVATLPPVEYPRPRISPSSAPPSSPQIPEMGRGGSPKTPQTPKPRKTRRSESLESSANRRSTRKTRYTGNFNKK